jgi:hypothetical protein
MVETDSDSREDSTRGRCWGRGTGSDSSKDLRVHCERRAKSPWDLAEAAAAAEAVAAHCS